MTIELPKTNQTLPLLRVLVADQWAGGSSPAISGGSWQELPMLQREVGRHGFEVVSWTRSALPEVGRAVLAYSYGVFADGRESVPPDLRNAIIRIQAAPRPALPSDAPVWATVWLGSIDYCEDASPSPGALIPRGQKLYHAVDLLYAAKRWLVNNHSVELVGAGGEVVRLFDMLGDHPGFNTSPGHSSRLLGNRGLSEYDIGGVQVPFHDGYGAGRLWSDQQAVEAVLVTSAPPDAPLFVFGRSNSGTFELLTSDLLAGASSWPVRHGENAWDFIAKVLRRERGRGLVFVDWIESSAEGPIQVFLSISPQLAGDITWTDPTSGTVETIRGATYRGLATTVDLTGDHRAVSGSLTISDPDQLKVSYLETEGEPITVAVTLAYRDGLIHNGDGLSLIRGWSETDQAAFVALGALARTEARWRSVFGAHRLNPFALSQGFGDGNGGASTGISRGDYRCSDAGYIVTPSPLDEPTSPLLVEILSDTPFVEGYTYTGSTPARSDGATEDDRGMPHRKPLAFIRKGADRYLEADMASGLSLCLHIDGDTIWAEHGGDAGAGTRLISVASPTNLAAAFDYRDLCFTVALRLPHCVRFASGTPGAGRRGKIKVPGLELWLSHPGAVWDLDMATGSASTGYAARRRAGNGSDAAPGILRDDRAELARVHATCWSFYGTDTVRRSASWSLKACGALGTFTVADGSTVSYPAIGQTVTELTANGQTFAVNGPVSSVAYDARKGRTDWEVAWQGLEYAP